MADDENISDIADRTEVVRKKYSRYFLMSVLALSVVTACLVVGFLGLKQIYETVAIMEAEQPLSRFDVFNKEIDEIKIIVKEQYAQHTEKMEVDDIREKNLKFNTIYNMAHEHEMDYSSVIKNYKKGMYQMASRTRGSGEWFEYFSKDIDVLYESSVERVSKLVRYTKVNE